MRKKPKLELNNQLPKYNWNLLLHPSHNNKIGLIGYKDIEPNFHVFMFHPYMLNIELKPQMINANV